MTMTFDETIRARHSVRGFLSTPLTHEQIRNVLGNAQLSPSNCNTQPWLVHIVSGEKKASLSEAMLHDARHEHYTPDFTFDNATYDGVYGERQKEQGKTYYEALGIARDDQESRAKSFRRNLTFFNAPHAAFLFMPSVGDNVRVASDIGMYAQTFLLSLTAQGLAGIPQTLLGFFQIRSGVS